MEVDGVDCAFWVKADAVVSDCEVAELC